MSQNYAISDCVGIESFDTRRFRDRRDGFDRPLPPGYLRLVELNAPGCLEIKLDSALVKLRPGAGRDEASGAVPADVFVTPD